MTYLTYYGYQYNGKKWKYKQRQIKLDVNYESAKQYAKELFKRLLNQKGFSVEGIAISLNESDSITSKELSYKNVYSKRKKGERKYRSNEESLGSLKTYIIYKKK